MFTTIYTYAIGVVGAASAMLLITLALADVWDQWSNRPPVVYDGQHWRSARSQNGNRR